MFLLILAAVVSGDVVKINTVNTAKPIQLMMGGVPQTFTKDAYGRMTWMENPSTKYITLIIGDDSHDLKTSATGAGYAGCNYNFDLFSDDEMYQNSGMECTKIFDKAPGAIELINDVGKSVYPAFDLGYGFSSDSVLGWLGAGMIAVYTSQNPYLAAIGAKEGTEVEVGYFDQSNYKSCGKVKVGEEFIKMLSECTGAEAEVASVVSPPGSRCRQGQVWSQFRSKCVPRFAEEAVAKSFRDPRFIPRAQAKAEGAVAFQTPTSTSADDWAVYGFAVIGMGFLAQQAYKMVVKKTSETTPIYAEV